MNQIEDYRKRAIALLCKKLPDDKVTQIDRQIDDYLRKAFKLPDRPPDSLPYVGWMVEDKNTTEGKMRTSQAGINLIKSHEGLRTKAYMCPANVLTIGYGHTGTVYPDMVITHQEAEALLKKDLIRFEDAVNKYATVPLNQNQFDALVSFSFNVGINAFANSTLLRLLNIGNSFQAASQFGRWVRGGGQRLPGLVRRREEERRLFLS